MTAYRFDKPDWLVTRLPVWEQLLSPLRGQPVQLLEIGSYEGRSAAWMAENLLAHRDAWLTCIDPCFDADVGATLRHNVGLMRDRTDGRVVLLEERSAAALPRLVLDGRQHDLIYVDGSHEAPDVLLDFVLSFELLKPGGLLVGDDYLWSAHLDGTVHAPQLAINAFAACYAERVELIHRDAQAWFRKK